MRLPSGYGEPTRLLGWDDVSADLERAQVYWVATTRPDGRPHVVPRDGIWLENVWYYGGSDDTVHNRNLAANPAAVMHIGDGMKAIIVEGEARHVTTERETAERLAEISNVKYSHYGLEITPDTYTTSGTWALSARRVLAWNTLFEDATRFIFG
jgi:hypothetical protein